MRARLIISMQQIYVKQLPYLSRLSAIPVLACCLAQPQMLWDELASRSNSTRTIRTSNRMR